MTLAFVLDPMLIYSSIWCTGTLSMKGRWPNTPLILFPQRPDCKSPSGQLVSFFHRIIAHRLTRISAIFAISFFWFGWTSFPSISIWAPLLSGLAFGWSVVWIFVSSSRPPRYPRLTLQSVGYVQLYHRCIPISCSIRTCRVNRMA